MSVRTPGYRPRQPARRRRPFGALALSLILLAGVPIGASCLVGVAQPGSMPSGAVALETAGPTTGARAAAVPADSPPQVAAEPEPTPTPTPDPTPTLQHAAIVPVTHFRTPIASTTFEEVGLVLAGQSSRYDALELVAGDADAILAALGAQRPTNPARLVLAANAASLSTDLAANRKRLAFLRADEVGPPVRALSWGRNALFGVGRSASLAVWTLFADVPAAAGATRAYDPATAWTLVAGGDILLDRGVYKTIKLDGKGVDFPFNGGTARITSRYCCSSFGWELPRTRRTGNAGAVRALLKGADIAMANFENPAPNQFRFHTSGTVFSADPRLIDGLRNAGIDYVSLANNHIRDAGGPGILQTIANLDKRGLRHSGAGKNLAAARTPAIMDAGGVQVAVLGYDAIAAGYAAGANRIGSAPLSARACREDVPKAREAGAEVVIVFPHWGVEYDATPFKGQQTLARACLDAGADMIIGNHAHWAGAVEVYKGKPIWYALGNFVFDQTWSEPTMEGITLELTFQGAQLRQVRMRPHIILDKAQPNFLDPNGDGKVVMGQIYQASKGLLGW